MAEYGTTAIDLISRINEFEERNGKLTAEQRETLFLMISAYYGYMSQGRGAGKTFLLDALREITGE